MHQSSMTTRRLFERSPTKINTLVHCRGRFHHATVVDYSAGGVRLDGTFRLLKKDPIRIEFLCGACVPARVAWSLGTQTGLVFAVPLATDHPAMIALSRRADLDNVDLDNDQKRHEG
jgi:hypothetical protein